MPLVGPQGIFKPAVLPFVPLSITTSPVEEGKPRPYDDSIGEDGLIGYKYRGRDPNHRENAGLREAMLQRIPLVYFFGLVPGFYEAEWPIFVVGDDPATLTFTLAVDDERVLGVSDEVVADDVTRARRAYVTAATQRRLHQSSFRERVLRAYHDCCSVCRLKHRGLLDAAHILPDSHPEGEPWVSNGLSLCKIHHAAYDLNILGIRPDLVMEIRDDILREHDGPMLTHGLQALHNQRLVVVPHSTRLRPKPAFLEVRYAAFRDSA